MARRSIQLTKRRKRIQYCRRLAKKYGNDICNLVMSYKAARATNEQIAAALNEKGYKTMRGSAFRGATVSNIIKGLDAYTLTAETPPKKTEDNVSGSELILKLLNSDLTKKELSLVIGSILK